MYRIITAEDRVRVTPEKFSLPVNDAVKEALADKLEGVLDQKVGSILAIVGIESVGEGKILAGDPAVHYQTKFQMLAYRPEMHELVTGVVIDNAEFGSFVRVGPLDGLVHISQLMDDYVSYDNKNTVFVGKETKRILKEGDKVRARVISISFAEQNKLGLTMRQAGLGSLGWIEEEKKKAKKGQ